MTTEPMFFCSCGFHCVEGQLARSGGVCPACKKDPKRADLATKYGNSGVQ